MVDLNKLAKRLQKNYKFSRIASSEVDPTDYLSVGNLGLDLCLDGGIAMGGYVVELVGGSQSCKTTIEQILLANFQKKHKEGIGLWLDRENAWSNDRAKFLGIDLNRVIVLGPLDIPTVAVTMKVLEDVLADFTTEPIFIGLDSVAAFDDGKDAAKANVGANAQYFHRLFRRLTGVLNKESVFVFSNHRTFKIGVVYGSPETSHGGEGPKFYSSYRIKLDNLKDIIDEDRGKEKVGNWIKAVVIKTRRGPSFRECVFPHFYKTGIPYLGGYDRLLSKRNWIQPNNTKEYAAFKQHSFKYKDRERLDGRKMEEIVKQYPELLFDTYPEWKECGPIEEEKPKKAKKEIINAKKTN